MSSLVWFFLLAMISPDLWAARVFPGCEILLETRYGRLMNLIAQDRQITSEELEEVANQDRPTNPLRSRNKNLVHVFAFRILEQAAQDSRTIHDWPQIRDSLRTLADRIRKSEQQVDEASEDQKWVFNPKLHMTTPYGNPDRIQYLFVPGEEKFLTWNSDSVFTDLTEVKLGKKTEKTGGLEPNAQLILRKNGEVWMAGNHKTFGFIVRKLGDPNFYFQSKSIKAGIAVLFEAADGRLIVVEASISGLNAYDISDRENVQTLLAEEGEFAFSPVLHSSEGGQLYLVAPASDRTAVYKLVDGKFTGLGRLAPPGRWGQKAIVATGKDEVLYVGQTTDLLYGYSVWKLKDGNVESVMNDPSRKYVMDSAMFHWDRNGDLILCISGAESNLIHLLNLTDGELTERSFPVASRLHLPAAWYRFANGQEVLAVSPHDSDAAVISVDDGGYLATFPAKGNRVSGPKFGRMPDGQTYLAVDADQHVQIYDLGKDVRTWHR